MKTYSIILFYIFKDFHLHYRMPILGGHMEWFYWKMSAAVERKMILESVHQMVGDIQIVPMIMMCQSYAVCI